jgi:hypothetical protein
MMGYTNVNDVAKAFQGFVITGAVTEPDDEGWQKLILMDRNTGKEFHIEPSADPEGNYPGFLFFGEGK